MDNCYGEFTQKEEPCQAGADLVVGSLIKNPGGGIAPTGGYIAVSYTHLDVYKRQPIVSSGRAAKLILRRWAKAFNRTADFVVIEGCKAGGHLGFSEEEDVYKRQGEYDKMRQSVFRSFALIAGMALADAIGIGYYLVKHRKETL